MHKTTYSVVGFSRMHATSCYFGYLYNLCILKFSLFCLTLDVIMHLPYLINHWYWPYHWIYFLITSVTQLLLNFVLQTKVSAAKEFQHRTTTFWCRLVGSEDTTDRSIISPYTSRVLKPYIRYRYAIGKTFFLLSPLYSLILVNIDN